MFGRKLVVLGLLVEAGWWYGLRRLWELGQPWFRDVREGFPFANVAVVASVARPFSCASWKACCSEKKLVVPLVH